MLSVSASIQMGLLNLTNVTKRIQHEKPFGDSFHYQNVSNLFSNKHF